MRISTPATQQTYTASPAFDSRLEPLTVLNDTNTISAGRPALVYPGKRDSWRLSFGEMAEVIRKSHAVSVLSDSRPWS